MRWWVVFFLFSEGLFAQAGLVSAKIQMHSSTARAGDELMLLVDPTCWQHQAPAMQKASADFGVTVQHKSSPNPRWAAVSAHVDADLSAQQINSLANQPCVLGVSENARFQITSLGDPSLANQPALTAIQHSEAEKIFFHPLFGIRQPVVVAIVDTGIQADHPDLVSRLWRGPSGENGYDFLHADNDPSDDNGHGTHVAGLIGAQRDNGIGIRGIMGEWTRLMGVKTQNQDGDGLLSDLINGIHYAADQGAEVINLSLAGKIDSQPLKDVIAYAIGKGSVVVVAAGNDGQEITPSNLVTPVGYAIDYPGLIGVGAIDALDFQRKAYSNFSTNYVEISAPGSAGTQGILSTYMDSTYKAIEGTSQATPQVAGAAALAIGFMKTHGKSASPAAVENWLEQSAINDPGLAGFFVGGRRLDLKQLGQLLLFQTVLDSSGGFDAPP